MKESTQKSKSQREVSQRQRFIDTAKEVDADESGEEFEGAFGKIVPPKNPPGKKSA
jgi:hypothetical protein